MVSGDKGAGEETDDWGTGGKASIRRDSEDDMKNGQQQARNGITGLLGESL